SACFAGSNCDKPRQRGDFLRGFHSRLPATERAMLLARHRSPDRPSHKATQRLMQSAGLGAALLLAPLLWGGPALADAQPNRIKIEYVPPKNPAFQTIYDTLKQHQTLEKLQQIFSPVRLQSDLNIKTTECGMSNAWYQRPTLTICYEYLADIL